MPAMRRQGQRELRGTIIVVVLVALALAIFFLDRVASFFHRTYTVVAVFPTAPGVRSGSLVWVAGVPSGTIREIALLPPGDTLARVALDLELSQSVAAQVRRDTRVRFSSARMVGERVVELLPGSAGAPRLLEGDTLRVGPDVQAEKVRASAAAARLALDSLMTDAAALRTRFSKRMSQASALSREAAAAQAEFARLQAGMQGGSLGRLMSIQAPGGPIDRVQARVSEIQQLLNRAEAKARTTRERLSPQQRSIMAHTKELSAELTELRRLMGVPVGTLGRMQKDSAIQKSMQGARTQLDSLITESKKHPLRYIF